MKRMLHLYIEGQVVLEHAQEYTPLRKLIVDLSTGQIDQWYIPDILKMAL